MKCFITGGTGFVGAHLTRFLLDQGHQVVATGRRKTPEDMNRDRFDYIPADTAQPGSWQESARDADAVFNLAGETIFKRWSESYKQQIYDSRIRTTRLLVDALNPDKTSVLCSVSAVGYYGNRGDEILSEDSPKGEDFLARISIDWEDAARGAETKGIRVVILRFGVVLGRNGGALAKMIPAFKAFAGGPVGTGDQWFPWIHMDDLLSSVGYVWGQDDINGPLNICSPNPVRNRDMAKALGRVLQRPSVMPTPAFMIRMIMGEMAEALLASQRVVPQKLLSHGFRFQYPGIEQALENLIK